MDKAIKGDGENRLIQATGLHLCSYVLIILANVIFKASFERNLTLEYPGAGASTQKKNYPNQFW